MNNVEPAYNTYKGGAYITANMKTMMPSPRSVFEFNGTVVNNLLYDFTSFYYNIILNDSYSFGSSIPDNENPGIQMIVPVVPSPRLINMHVS